MGVRKRKTKDNEKEKRREGLGLRNDSSPPLSSETIDNKSDVLGLRWLSSETIDNKFDAVVSKSYVKM